MTNLNNDIRELTSTNSTPSAVARVMGKATAAAAVKETVPVPVAATASGGSVLFYAPFCKICTARSICSLTLV